MDKLNKYYYDILLCTSITYFINMLLTIKMINDNYIIAIQQYHVLYFSLLVLT